jgi:putative transcriptional regulator
MKSLKGRLLIAAPGLTDPNFVRTVVFIAEHNKSGAFGLVLNRPARVKVAELWAAVSDEPCPSEAAAFAGGPVEKNAVILLHGCGDLAAETEPVIAGVYLASEVELLGEVLRRSSQAEEAGGAAGGIEFRVFCGYSGWGPGQLDAEMKAGGWLTIPASAEHIFRHPAEKLWSMALESVGGIYRFFAFMPADPEMN